MQLTSATPSPAPLPTRDARETLGKLLAVAALIGPAAGPVQAESAPERGQFSTKFLSYEDKQEGADRISVIARSYQLSLPLGEHWSIDAGTVSDVISGASPGLYSDRSTMARLHDRRRGNDLRLSHYFEQGSLSLGGAVSKESDYLSHNLSIQGSLHTEDKNTTLHFGSSVSNDRINPSNRVVVNEKKEIVDVMIGVTQVLTARDIVQVNLTHGDGHGYYSDPYKFLDNRPRNKSQTAVLTRWNHYHSDFAATSRVSYRYYQDSFSVHAHTVGYEFAKQIGEGYLLTPSLRLHSQSAASFYSPPGAGIPVLPALGSGDHRLSAFGARTLGLKLSKELDRDWLFDIKLEHYEQRGAWKLGNRDKSGGIDTMTATIFQLGISRFF